MSVEGQRIIRWRREVREKIDTGIMDELHATMDKLTSRSHSDSALILPPLEGRKANDVHEEMRGKKTKSPAEVREMVEKYKPPESKVA